MPFNRGDLIIGDFIPSQVASIDYTKKDVTVTCISRKKDDGSYPIDEIMEIQTKVIHGYDNTNVLTGGTVLQSFSSDDIILINDGFETFIGVVVDVNVPEDQFRDDQIIYQIKIARYIPPNDPQSYTELPEGDETVWDDDWEEGYEEYGTGCGTTSFPESYSAGHYYNNVTVYLPEEKAGLYKNEQFGWTGDFELMHTLPNNLKGYTVFIDLGNTYEQVIFTIGFGGQGNPVVGEFGEIRYEPPVTIPDANFYVNGDIMEVPWVGDLYKVPWIPGSGIDNITMQNVAVNIHNHYVVFRVETDLQVFIVQNIIPVTMEEAATVTCTGKSGSGKDNTIPEYIPQPTPGTGGAIVNDSRKNVRILPIYHNVSNDSDGGLHS